MFFCFASGKSPPPLCGKLHKSIKRLLFTRVSICPPADTSTNLNKDLVNAENVTLDKEVRGNLVKLAAKWIEDNEAAEIFEELESLKIENHWRNWYLGYTEVRLPYTDYGARTHKIHTTAVPGSLSSPLFGQVFTEESFHQKMTTELFIYLPGNITGNLSMVTMIEIDTKESFGGTDLIRRYGPEYKLYRYTERINESWYQPIAETYNVYYKRDIGKASIADWRTKRMTGFSASWYLQNMTGHRVSIQPWDKFREPPINKDTLIINSNLMTNMLGLVKSEAKSPHNKYFVRMVNIVDSVINSRHYTLDKLWEDVENFKSSLLGQDELECYVGMLMNNDMETFLEEEETRMNMTRGRGPGPVHNNNISDSALKSAAKLFVYLANCDPTGSSKQAWNKFYADLLTNSSPRLILQTLTSIKKMQTEGQRRINIPAELISRLGKYFSFQFDKIKIAHTSSRKMAKEQDKSIGTKIPDCFHHNECAEIHKFIRTIGI